MLESLELSAGNAADPSREGEALRVQCCGFNMDRLQCIAPTLNPQSLIPKSDASDCWPQEE